MRRISLARPFNNAWRIYAAREPYRREEIEHRVAWAAVSTHPGKAALCVGEV
jgi:cation transport regulator ChaB